MISLPAHWMPGMAGRFMYCGQGYPSADEVMGTCWRCTQYEKLSEHAELCSDCLEQLRDWSPM